MSNVIKKGIQKKKKTVAHNKNLLKRLRKFSSCETVYHEFHLSSNAEDVSYVIQRQYTICDGKKATRDDVIFTRISHLPALIEQLQKTYDEHKKKQDKQTATDIVIDEWDINSNQSMYRKELAKIYVEHMSKDFVTVLHEKCVGCQLQEGNQLGHQLCLMDDIDQQIRICFAVLLKRVDNFNANEQCFERLKDSFIAATTDKHVFLDTTQLVNDNEWIDHVNKLLIKELK